MSIQSGSASDATSHGRSPPKKAPGGGSDVYAALGRIALLQRVAEKLELYRLLNEAHHAPEDVDCRPDVVARGSEPCSGATLAHGRSGGVVVGLAKKRRRGRRATRRGRRGSRRARGARSETAAISASAGDRDDDDGRPMEVAEVPVEEESNEDVEEEEAEREAILRTHYRRCPWFYDTIGRCVSLPVYGREQHELVQQYYQEPGAWAPTGIGQPWSSLLPLSAHRRGRI